jgi:hypothetical protein
METNMSEEDVLFLAYLALLVGLPPLIALLVRGHPGRF